MRIGLVLAALLLAGCDTAIYDAAKPGMLRGTLAVMWVGEGSPDTGNGQFVFVPLRNDPLTFTRPDGRVIAPDMIYTDGGSIPRIAQPLRGLSPWGYAPAYMMHDWLFVANKCLTDGDASPNEADVVDGMEFRDSAVILAEVIRTLIAERRVARNDVAPAAITWAVTSPASRTLWQAKGECPSPRISDAHRAQVNAAFADAAGLRFDRTRVTPAQIVAQFSF
jgi:hypothetical protein